MVKDSSTYKLIDGRKLILNPGSKLEVLSQNHLRLKVFQVSQGKMSRLYPVQLLDQCQTLADEDFWLQQTITSFLVLIDSSLTIQCFILNC
jgi:hypothetical protein